MENYLKIYENNDKISHNKSPSTSSKENHCAKGSVHYAIIVKLETSFITYLKVILYKI